jgi:hypothetical protein
MMTTLYSVGASDVTTHATGSGQSADDDVSGGGSPYSLPSRPVAAVDDRQEQRYGSGGVVAPS